MNINILTIITYCETNFFVPSHLQPKVLRLATLLATSAGFATETVLAGSPKGLGFRGNGWRWKWGQGLEEVWRWSSFYMEMVYAYGI